MSATLRRTVIGALVGGGLFFLASLYQSVRAGGDLLGYAAPMAAMIVIGATVGGLLGPLLGRIGSRGASGEEGSGEDRDGAPEGRGGMASRRPDPPDPPVAGAPGAPGAPHGRPGGSRAGESAAGRPHPEDRGQEEETP